MCEGLLRRAQYHLDKHSTTRALVIQVSEREQKEKGIRTGWIFISPSAWTRAHIFSAVLLTPLSNTLWFRTVTPASYKRCAPSRVIQLISFTELKWVWMQICLPIFRAFFSSSMTVFNHSSFGSRSRLGDTESPLVANRKRRICGILSSLSPIYLICSGSRR